MPILWYRRLSRSIRRTERLRPKTDKLRLPTNTNLSVRLHDRVPAPFSRAPLPLTHATTVKMAAIMNISAAAKVVKAPKVREALSRRSRRPAPGRPRRFSEREIAGEPRPQAEVGARARAPRPALARARRIRARRGAARLARCVSSAPLSVRIQRSRAARGALPGRGPSRKSPSSHHRD